MRFIYQNSELLTSQESSDNALKTRLLYFQDINKKLVGLGNFDFIGFFYRPLYPLNTLNLALARMPGQIALWVYQLPEDVSTKVQKVSDK